MNPLMMKIIEGTLPSTPAWRALILLNPETSLGLVWQLSLALARANNGQLIAAVVIPEASSENLHKVKTILAEVRGIEQSGANEIYPILAIGADYQRSVADLAKEAGTDLLLLQAEGLSWHSLNRVSCTVAVVRGHQYSQVEGENGESDPLSLKRILVPTSGGPNVAHALSLLYPLAKKSEITALYVARASEGANGEALGHTRLRQTLQFVGADNRIKTRLIQSDTAIEGIVAEASQDYDLVVIGATQESSFERALFGDIPAAVVRNSKKPVMVVRQPKWVAGSIVRQLAWSLRHILPPLTATSRAEAYVRIRRSTRPDTDYYILMALSAAIASMGLMLNSPAVVIGAMLVAPLMSPIVGTGMAVILGDARFLRLSLAAVIRGVLVALVVSFLSGLLRLQEPMTGEVLARTEPNLLDLGVALFSGFAGAYALCRSEAAAALPGVAIAAALVPPLASVGILFAGGEPRLGLGALLLFSTNLVAISSAAVVVFLVLGFRPAPAKKSRRQLQLQSVRMAGLLLASIALLLGTTTVRLVRETAVTNNIHRLVRIGVAEMTAAEIADVQIDSLNADTVRIDVTVRSTRTIPYPIVVELQRFLATELQREVTLTLTVIPTTRLDPLTPPTQTPTAAPSPALGAKSPRNGRVSVEMMT
jgi:uncharacterized hydrophobic protein (TIGR00271 family)